jgi:putative transposase
VKYALIRRHRRVWPIRVQCRMLGVSVAGYHEHFVRRLHMARRRHLSAEALVVQIRAVYVANRGAYGWPRIWRALRAQGIRVGKQRVQKLMRQHGIRARGKRRFRVTTDSRHGLPIAPQPAEPQLHRGCAQPGVDRRHHLYPNQPGLAFLGRGRRLFSRRVVGWSIQPEMRSHLVIDALEMAWLHRRPDRSARPIFYSDRGC